MTELASVLRSWRDRVSPAAAGLPSGGDRRSPGLRREELAALAGLSVDYVVRLEQGRASNPSPQVLRSLARALRLTEAERDHLFRVAGAAVPLATSVPRHITPGIQRIVDRLGDVPVGVFSASWDTLLYNPLWTALFGNPPLTGRNANLVWTHFTSRRTDVDFTEGHHEEFARDLVADLHSAVGRYPEDAPLLTLIAELKQVSPEFAALWGTATIGQHQESQKTVHTALVGPLVVDCDVLSTPGTDMKIVVYTAVPGSQDAEKLDLLRVSALQTFAPAE